MPCVRRGYRPPNRVSEGCTGPTHLSLVSIAAYIEAPTNSDRDKSKPGFDLLGFAKTVKADLGVHNIEPLNAHFASTDPDYVRLFRDDLKAIGVGVVNVAADVPGSLYDPDEQSRKRAIEARAKWMMWQPRWVPRAFV